MRPREADLGLDLSLLVSVLFQGPIDVGLTTMAWGLETNFVPLNVGMWPWVGLKIVSIALAVGVWWWAREYGFHRDVAVFSLGLWAGFAVVTVMFNLVVMGYIGVFWL